MELMNKDYVDFDSLEKFIIENKIPDDNRVLIQIFFSNQEISKVYQLRDELNTLLPNTSMISTSTSGVIADGGFVDDIIKISFSIFKASTTKSIGYSSKNCDEIINDLESTFVTDDTKLFVIFANTFTFDSSSFIEKLGESFPAVSLAGGNAGDDLNFKKCELFTNKEKDCDVVIAIVDSKQLKIKTKYLLNWQTVGRKMVVTKADGVKVYEINNKSALEIYRYYLGDDVADDLLGLGIEFPIIFNDHGVDIARSLLGFDRDEGSISFAGSVPEGASVQFAYANIEHIEKKNRDMLLKDFNYRNEAIYIYSCIARRQMLGAFLNEELENLNDIAPTIGFLTYGEFFHDTLSCQNDLLNITTTYVVLNESDCSEPFELEHVKIVKDKRDNILKAITTLVSRTNSELEEKIKLLEDTQNRLVESEKMASLGALVSGVAHEINTPLGVGLTGMSQITYEVEELKKDYESNALTESRFKSYIDRMQELSKTIFSSLENAAKLVKSFKHISVDQHSNESRIFNLSEYVNDTVLSLKNILKQKQIIVNNDIHKGIDIESFPGVYAQIFTNLIINSVKHGFESSEDNRIDIYADETKPLTIHYKDNGKGIDASMGNKIFDPFFTTARGQGGSGLGLNIVYNLITQKLKGEIKIVHDGEGLHYVITLADLFGGSQ